VRAVVIEQPGGPEVLTLVDVPEPVPGAGEVLVAVEAVGVNPVDAGNRSNPSWAGVAAPYVVGYELAGHVVATGEPVWALLPARLTRHGALAEQVAVPQEYLAPRPPQLDAIVAAALPLAGCTALQVLKRMPLVAGSWVLVHGASGGVGHLLVQMAGLRGFKVAAASRPADRVRMEGHGVRLWLDRASRSVAADAERALGHPLAAVVDLVGGQLESSLPHIATDGHAATIVDLEGDLDLAIDRNIDLHGVLVQPGRDRLYQLAAEVGAGVLPDIADTYPLERVADAHRRLEAGRVNGKLVITL
jgi:NADPH2:quinone reductase